MMYEKKIERAMEWLKAQGKSSVNEELEDSTIIKENALDEDNLDSKLDKVTTKKYFDEGLLEDEPIESKDLFAIIISALLILSPVILIVLGAYALIAYLMFG